MSQKPKKRVEKITIIEWLKKETDRLEKKIRKSGDVEVIKEMDDYKKKKKKLLSNLPKF